MSACIPLHTYKDKRKVFLKSILSFFLEAGSLLLSMLLYCCLLQASKPMSFSMSFCLHLLSQCRGAGITDERHCKSLVCPSWGVNLESSGL